MNAEIIINTKTFDEEVYNWIFGKEGYIWYVIDLVIDGEVISSITQTELDLINEIFEIDIYTESFDVDLNRLTYLLHKYRNYHRFIEAKKILRPIVRFDIKTINIIKKG